MRKIFLRQFFSCLLIFLLAGACLGKDDFLEGAAGELKILCEPECMPFLDTLGEETAAKAPDLKVTVKRYESLEKAVSKIEKGTAEIVISSEPLRKKLPSIISSPFAIYGIALTVNKSNTVREILSIDAVARVYEGKILSWKELGGLPTLAHTYSYGKDSLLKKLFLKKIMGGKKISQKTLAVSGEEEMEMLISADPQGFGYISIGSLGASGNRLLRVEGCTPSSRNALLERYPLAGKVYIHISRKPPRQAAAFAKFLLLSRDARKILTANHLIPVSRR